MEAKTESVKKEFENLLKEDFKKRDLKEGSIIKATVTEIGKKHVFVDLNAKSEGIIPIEEFKISKELESLKTGSKVDVYLERIDTYKGEMLVSRERARRMGSWKKMQAAFQNQEEVEGVITNKVRGGMVVNIDSCLCFLPGSQIDTKPLKNFDHLMNVPLKFLCVKMDSVRGNIVVSRRAILEKSKEENLKKVLSKIKEGSIVDSEVRAVLDWGAFVSVMGADALLHVTDLSYSRVKKTSDLLTVGQTLKTKVIKIDKSMNPPRISVSVKALTRDPYEDLDKKFQVNKVYTGIVSKCVDFGCFVKLKNPKTNEIEEGLTGLVHQSELSFLNRAPTPSQVLAPSQEILVKIIELDSKSRRISLSYKQNGTMKNPWDTFLEKNPVGSAVSGTIINITTYGLFLSLGDSGLTGMIHEKNISWNESENNLKRFKKGEKLKAKILEVEKGKKIRLGIRELEKSPLDYFKDEKLGPGSIITVTVKEILPKKGIKVAVGDKGNLITTIRKNELALNPEDQRESIYQPGNRLDCAIVEINYETNKIILSIAEKERLDNEEAVKNFGDKSSGQSLKAIFGKVLGSKKKKKSEKKGKE
tara:strand:+ start:1979 stop:3742 length:1764 start_codon:yes stop_codon:yes gene_type:complete